MPGVGCRNFWRGKGEASLRVLFGNCGHEDHLRWLQKPQRSPVHQCCRSRLSALHHHICPDHLLSNQVEPATTKCQWWEKQTRHHQLPVRLKEGPMGKGPIQRWDRGDRGSLAQCIVWLCRGAAAPAAWQGTKSAFHWQISKCRSSVSSSTPLTPALWPDT